jgi:hypothetical protein
VTNRADIGNMLGRAYEDPLCSIARTLEVVGERWTQLTIRDAHVLRTSPTSPPRDPGVALGRSRR